MYLALKILKLIKQICVLITVFLLCITKSVFYFAKSHKNMQFYEKLANKIILRRK